VILRGGEQHLTCRYVRGVGPFGSVSLAAVDRAPVHHDELVVVHNRVLHVHDSRAQFAPPPALADIARGLGVAAVYPGGGLHATYPRLARNGRGTEVIGDSATHKYAVRVVFLPADARVARLEMTAHLGAFTAVRDLLVADDDQLHVIDDGVLQLPHGRAQLATGPAEAQVASLLAVDRVAAKALLDAEESALRRIEGVHQLLAAAAAHAQQIAVELVSRSTGVGGLQLAAHLARRLAHGGSPPRNLP